MSDSSKIEWTEATWNPVTGCFGLMAWWLWAQWDECHSMGLSVFYCIKHVL